MNDRESKKDKTTEQARIMTMSCSSIPHVNLYLMIDKDQVNLKLFLHLSNEMNFRNLDRILRLNQLPIYIAYDVFETTL